MTLTPLKKKLLLIFCLALLLVTIFVFLPPRGGDNDIWWHLKYGEHFVQNFTWYIDHSAFSWTPSSPDWKYVTWIGSSLLYLVYAAAGFPGLFIFHSFLMILTLGTYLLYIRLINKPLSVSDIFCMLLVALSSHSVYIKPDSFTTLFFALTVFIYFYSKTAQKSIFLWNVPLYLIWVNTHGGFVIGLLFISIVFFAELVNFYLIKSAPLSRESIRYFALGVFLSFAVLVINPYGLQYITSIFHDLFISDYMEHAGDLYAFMSIWKHLSPASIYINFSAEAWRLIAAMAILLLTCAHSYSKVKRIDMAVIAVNIIFFLAAMSTIRSAKFFPIIWLFSIAFIIHPIETHMPRKKLTSVSLVLILLFSLVHVKSVLTINNCNSWFGSGFVNSWLPEKEARFIKDHKLPAPIFNDYLTGGYMIWSMYPEYKVFLDPRYGPFTKEVRSDWFGLAESPTVEKITLLASKYNFNTVFVNFGHLSVIRQFIHSPDWRLVYFDTNAVVLVSTGILKNNEQAFSSDDLGPERFSHVNDPLALTNIFNIYALLDAHREMAVIRNIYFNNVSRYYYLREHILASMDFMITNRISEAK
jgi:hypothetical protein